MTNNLMWLNNIPSVPFNYMEENFGAINVHLTEADMSELKAGFAELTIEGKRAPEALLVVHDIGANFGTSSVGTHGNSPLRVQAQHAV